MKTTMEATIGQPPARLVVRTPAGDYPLVMGSADAAPLLRKTDRAVRDDLASGALPSLPRPAGGGAHWRIASAVLFERLGIPFEVVSADCPS